MMQVVLQHVSVPRPPGQDSAELARQFYRDLIGLAEKPVPSSIAHLDLVWFSLGGDLELHVFANTASPATTGQHFCLNVGDVEAMRQVLTEGGYQTWSPDVIHGRPRFFCRDPFENVVEFTQIVDDYMKYQSRA